MEVIAIGVLSNAKSIKDLEHGHLVVVYGKSGTGKTVFGSTFPKPLLYVKIGDDGSNTIKHVDGIKAVSVESIGQLKTLADELKNDTVYKTVLVDTFSLIVNEWRAENIIKKRVRMDQQAWGRLLDDTEEIIRKFHEVSLNKWVVLTGHEVIDSIEGTDGELLPDVRIAVSKGARTYIEGMANIGVHTKIMKKEVDGPDGETRIVTRFALDIGPNPYYWTKVQTRPGTKIPPHIVNPTFDKLLKVIE